jgi:hypothetical protein
VVLDSQPEERLQEFWSYLERLSFYAQNAKAWSHVALSRLAIGLVAAQAAVLATSLVRTMFV